MKTFLQITVYLLLINLNLVAQDTFSIVAVDPETGEVGSAGASCVDLSNFPGLDDGFLGELFPGKGAINTQAFYAPENQAIARDQMNLNKSPDEIIAWLIANDFQGTPQFRQYGVSAIIANQGVSAAHTGASTNDYKGHILGNNYAIQGNILLNETVLQQMESNFQNAEGDLACKLMAAMQGANIVGADSRCASNNSSSLFAFLKVAQPDDVFGSPSFSISLRTADGDQIEPIDSLQVLFDLERSCNSVSVIENDHGSLYQIFPNPVNGNLNISTNWTDDKFQLRLYDSNAKVLYTDFFEKEAMINMNQLNQGSYIIELIYKGKRYSSKILKQ